MIAWHWAVLEQRAQKVHRASGRRKSSSSCTSVLYRLVHTQLLKCLRCQAAPRSLALWFRSQVTSRRITDRLLLREPSDWIRIRSCLRPAPNFVGRHGAGGGKLAGSVQSFVLLPTESARSTHTHTKCCLVRLHCIQCVEVRLNKLLD